MNRPQTAQDIIGLNTILRQPVETMVLRYYTPNRNTYTVAYEMHVMQEARNITSRDWFAVFGHVCRE